MFSSEIEMAGGMSQTMRILFVTNSCRPYWIHFYEKLTKIHSVEFFFSLEKKREDNPGKFHFIGMHNSNFNLIRKLFSRKYDLVISSFFFHRDVTFLWVFVLSRLLGKPIILWV